jgi:hypothetical protein
MFSASAARVLTGRRRRSNAARVASAVTAPTVTGAAVLLSDAVVEYTACERTTAFLQPLESGPEFVQGLVGEFEQGDVPIQVVAPGGGQPIGAASRPGVGDIPARLDQALPFQIAQRAVDGAGITLGDVQFSQPGRQVVPVIGTLSEQQQQAWL